MTLGAALLLALLALALGCAAPEPGASLAGSRPNLVLVVLCSFRTDHLGAAGYGRDLTPFLDRLAQEGVFFEQAVASSSWTKPTAASLLTGLTPNVHQMLDFYPLDAIRERRITPGRVLPEGFVTLPEALAEAGYATACRVNNVHAGEFFGLTQGCQDQVTRHGMRTPAMVADLAAWLEGLDRRRPFFFLLFTRDAHTPYNPPYPAYRRLDRTGRPPPEEGYREWRRQLDAEVRRRVEAGEAVPEELRTRWVDLYDAQLPALDAALAEIPRVLAQAGVAGDTWIVVTGDHGERFFEHGGIGHGGRLDEAVLRVPLILHGPGLPAGRRIPDLVRSIDLYPTLAALAGAATPPVLQGESLLPLLAGLPPRETPERSAFASFNGIAHAVRLGSWKLYAGPGDVRALYDLASDPGESRDRLAAERRAAHRLARELARWREQEEALARVVAPAGTRELPPEVIRELEALGYL